MECGLGRPDCGVSPGHQHGMGCGWERCPDGGAHLWDCRHEPALHDRLPWMGRPDSPDWRQGTSRELLA
jgi:hypothetical protein